LLLIQAVAFDFHISTSCSEKVMFRFGQAIAVCLKSTTTLVDLDLSWNDFGDKEAEAWDPGEDRPAPAERVATRRIIGSTPCVTLANMCGAGLTDVDCMSTWVEVKAGHKQVVTRH